MDIFRKLPYVPQRIVVKHYFLIRKKYTYENSTKVFEHCKTSDFNKINEFINNGLDLNLVKINDNTIIRSILLNNQIKNVYECIKYLLEKGANPNLMFYEHTSNLSLSIFRGFTSVATLLVNYGSKINFIEANKNYTPLYSAVFMRNKKIVEVLLKNNADVNFKCESRTPLNLAIFLNEKEIEHMIRSHHHHQMIAQNDH